MLPALLHLTTLPLYSQVILNCRASEGDGTYMGVDSCGDKLVGAITQRVCDLTHEGRPVTHITLIGYSMGEWV